MTFAPVKIPSTVFNNMLVDIMKKLAEQHNLDFVVTRDYSRTTYSVVTVKQGDSVGRNPFQSTSASTQSILSINALKEDRSIYYDDPLLGIDLKQFFMNEQEVTDYFAQFENAMKERIDKALEEGKN